MSYEDEFAAMEAQLIAEETGVAPPVEKKKKKEKAEREILSVKGGEIYSISSFTNVNVNLGHGVNSFNGIGLSTYAGMLGHTGEFLIKVDGVSGSIFSARVVNKDPDEKCHCSHMLIFRDDQPAGIFTREEKDDEFHDVLSTALDLIKETKRIEKADLAKKKAEAIEKEAAIQKALEANKGSNRDKWACLLDDIYGEELWDITSTNELIIHFPEVEITNDHGIKHIMRDLYVSWQLTDKYAPSGNLCGYRATKTLAEYETAYNHSHLGVGNERGWNATFCLGHGDFGNLINGLNADRSLNWDQIQKALVMIHLYVGWESISGGPYINMTSIKRSTSTSANPRMQIGTTTMKRVYDQWISKIEGETQVAKIQVNDGIKLFKANTTEVNSGLVDAVMHVLGSDYLDVLSPDGKHTPLYVAQHSTSSSDKSYIERYSAHMVNNGPNKTFRGSRIIPKIYVPGGTITEEEVKEYTKVPMLSITKFVIDKFENDLNMHAINKTK